VSDSSTTRTALSKDRLVQIATREPLNSSPLGTTTELAFENFVLRTFRRPPSGGLPGGVIPRNTKRYPSPVRDSLTGGRFTNVVPDGVTPLVIRIFPVGGGTFNESVYYEVKAVSNTKLEPSYENSQIIGFLDALNGSDAKIRGENPAIVFITTSNVIPLSPQTITAATRQNIGVFHSIACETSRTKNGVPQLTTSNAVNLNPVVYILRGLAPGDYGGNANTLTLGQSLGIIPVP
jgi:hypothetical protein